MKRRWYILSALLGMAAAAIVLSWPVTPIWRTAVDAGSRVLGFNRDSSIIYTAHGFRADNDNRSAPRVCGWDTNSGELLGSVEIPLPKGFSSPDATLSPDSTTLLICGHDASHKVESVSYLYDAYTGRRRAGPFVGLFASVGESRSPFSCNSQWIWMKFGSDGLEILETATGKSIVQLRERFGAAVPRDCCLAPDGRAAAIHWRAMTNESEHHYLQIISLPSGVEQPDFELIGSLWEETLKWSNNRVQVKMTEAVSPGKFMKRVYSFDVTSIGTGVGTEEPLLGTPTNETDGVNLWDDGPGWVAYLQWEPIGQNKWRAWNKWLGEKIGIKSKNERMHADTFRLVDSPSGKVHCEFPVSYPITLSDDAKRVACIDPNLGLEVWNADPWPRWPMALAAAVLAAGLVLLTGRWRTAARRRVTNTTTA